MRGHRGHAYCGRLCLPHFLYDEFQSCLGEKAEEFDLLVWVTKQDKQFERDFGVIAEPLTAWREAFQAELAAKGWFTPKRRPVIDRRPASDLSLTNTWARYREGYKK